VRVAFVHDYLTQFGGAERVLLEILKLYPEAPLYTSLSDAAIVRDHFSHVDVRASFLQRIPGAPSRFRSFLPLYPAAFESLRLHDYDLVISSTTAFAKGVRVAPHAVHVCYINTPTRFLWYPEEYASPIIPPLLRPFFRLCTPGLRLWDLAAAQRPHRLVSNSQHVATRVREIYRRSSDVVHCPVDAAEFSETVEAGDSFLVMTRLLPYKRVQLAIEACNALALPLIVAGTGPDEKRLQALAGPTISFAGQVDDAQRRRLIQRARALIVAGTEDFGLVSLEAAAAGRPTVAYRAGGALETVVEGETGIFFDEPTSHSLARALQALSAAAFDRARMAAHVKRFSPDLFRAKLAALIEQYLRERQNGKP